MDRQKRLLFQTSGKERMAYCLCFLGLHILWGYVGFVETFLTDIGIAAASAAMILLAGYKLRSEDVQIMAQYNNGEITKAEAETLLADKYGPAGND